MAKTQTSTKPLYAAIGAGSLAVEKAKELPERVVKLPGTVTARIGGLPGELVERVRKLSNGNGSPDLRALPKRVAQELPKRAGELPERARTLTTDAQKRAKKAYKTFSKEGEKVLKRLEKRRSKGRKPAASNGRKKPEPVPTTSVSSISSVPAPSPAPDSVGDGQQTL